MDDTMLYPLKLTRGFLPESDPLAKLPAAFAVWEQAAAELPKWLLAKHIRRGLEKLPVFPVEQLRTPEQIERAMMILSFLGHAYVWGEPDPADILPAVIALPWYQVAKLLQRPPVLSYASYALANWRRLDADAPVELGNIVLLQNFLGGMDEEWFILVHVDIEAKAGSGLRAIGCAQQAVADENAGGVINALLQMKLSLTASCEVLDRMSEHCDPYIYYNRVRPYIHGWKNHPVLKQGLIYQGVEEYQGRPQFFRGETGAQSAIIPSFDAALGIVHTDDILSQFLKEMREYMTPEQRDFIDTVAQNAAIRQYVIDQQQHFPELKKYYNDCILLIERFRSTHIKYATQYIQKQHQVSLANPNAVGTGGTPFVDYLRKHRDETNLHLI